MNLTKIKNFKKNTIPRQNNIPSDINTNNASGNNHTVHTCS